MFRAWDTLVCALVIGVCVLVIGVCISHCLLCGVFLFCCWCIGRKHLCLGGILLAIGMDEEDSFICMQILLKSDFWNMRELYLDEFPRYHVFRCVLCVCSLLCIQGCVLGLFGRWCMVM